MEAETFMVTIEGVEQKVCCRPEKSVLVAMEAQGMARIPVGCRGGGCGICKVRVISGKYKMGKMAVCHVSGEEQAEGYALACRLYPESDLTVCLAGKSRRALMPETYREKKSEGD